VSEANLLTEWARLLMGSFAQAGISNVVLSPGSRSTPFLVAAVREARVQCHDVVDERAAAFFALGQARWTQRPSLVLCTSGTAGAHYFPAVVEASQARIPLVVVTADRPTELQDCAAAQTIDQLKLYGGYVRRFFEIGSPDAGIGAMRALRRMAAQATFASVWPDPGPVHLNVRASKPLEPRRARTEAERDLAARVDALLAGPIPVPSAPQSVPDRAAVAAVARACRRARAGVIVCGPAPSSAERHRSLLLNLARSTGFPLWAEITSQLRLWRPDGVSDAICDAFDAILRCAKVSEGFTPDVVIQVGPPPTSSAWERFGATHARATRIIVGNHAWNDPTSSASTLLFGDVGSTLAALVDALAEEGDPPPQLWARTFRTANRVARDVIAHEATEGSWSEGAAVRAVVERLPRRSVLVLGNSLPLRHAETFCGQGAADAIVLCQRGGNGIEGLLAGALGTAAASGRPTTLVVGDVSLLHDLNSLMIAAGETAPFVLVVINNSGGRIFEQLPVGREAEVSSEELGHVTTPHSFHFGPAASMFGLRYDRAESLHDLDLALRDAYATAGRTLVECVVPAHGASEQERRLLARLQAALAELERERREGTG
jgi:2-succinyl-5-enolpyruvyl-6-hydroxy-3-cyclohexene-1-carboxylate synthase